MKIIPIRIGGSTLLACDASKGFPIEGGNCFDLVDIDNSWHTVVNFGYENFKEWVKRSKMSDVMVRGIPGSDTAWEICDGRIPKEWYKRSNCPVCSPFKLEFGI